MHDRSNLWLDFWSANTFGRSPGFYMGIYGGLGAAQAITSLASGVLFSVVGVLAAQSLHANAVKSVFRAPVSFFDTTPLGRVLNR